MKKYRTSIRLLRGCTIEQSHRLLPYYPERTAKVCAELNSAVTLYIADTWQGRADTSWAGRSRVCFDGPPRCARQCNPPIQLGGRHIRDKRYDCSGDARAIVSLAAMLSGANCHDLRRIEFGGYAVQCRCLAGAGGYGMGRTHSGLLWQAATPRSPM
jgi:hypothetical protein